MGKTAKGRQFQKVRQAQEQEKQFTSEIISAMEASLAENGPGFFLLDFGCADKPGTQESFRRHVEHLIDFEASQVLFNTPDAKPLTSGDHFHHTLISF